MSDLISTPHDNDEAALIAAVNKSRASQQGVPHSEMREWLYEIAAGNFDANPPEPRDLS